MNNRGDSDIWFGVLMAGLVLFLLFLVGLLRLPNRITTDRALVDIARQEQVQVSDITVYSHTDDNAWIGSPYDVKYELQIQERPFQAECIVTSWWSQMVCKTYKTQ